jgi:hypothetical protein
VKDNLALMRNSLVLCLIGRGEHLNTKAKYRSALDLDPEEPSVKVSLINTAICLAQAFQKKNGPKI